MSLAFELSEKKIMKCDFPSMGHMSEQVSRCREGKKSWVNVHEVLTQGRNMKNNIIKWSKSS